MAFNQDAFLKAVLVPREGTVPVPNMKEWFKSGEKAVWKCKSISGQDLGVANQIASKQNIENAKAMIEALQSRYKLKVESFEKLIGIKNDRPSDISKRIEIMLRGSVDLDPDKRESLDVILKICEVYPVEFYIITDKILELTGQGYIVGKPKPSGKKRISKAA